MTFTWDPEKDAINRRKHAVGFREAASVLQDSLSTTYPDPAHSRGEQRYVCDDRPVETGENARGGARGPRRHDSYYQCSARYAARAEVL